MTGMTAKSNGYTKCEAPERSFFHSYDEIQARFPSEFLGKSSYVDQNTFYENPFVIHSNSKMLLLLLLLYEYTITDHISFQILPRISTSSITRHPAMNISKIKYSSLVNVNHKHFQDSVSFQMLLFKIVALALVSLSINATQANAEESGIPSCFQCKEKSVKDCFAKENKGQPKYVKICRKDQSDYCFMTYVNILPKVGLEVLGVKKQTVFIQGCENMEYEIVVNQSTFKINFNCGEEYNKKRRKKSIDYYQNQGKVIFNYCCKFSWCNGASDLNPSFMKKNPRLLQTYGAFESPRSQTRNSEFSGSGGSEMNSGESLEINNVFIPVSKTYPTPDYKKLSAGDEISGEIIIHEITLPGFSLATSTPVQPKVSDVGTYVKQTVEQGGNMELYKHLTPMITTKLAETLVPTVPLSTKTENGTSTSMIKQKIFKSIFSPSSSSTLYNFRISEAHSPSSKFDDGESGSGSVNNNFQTTSNFVQLETSVANKFLGMDVTTESIFDASGSEHSTLYSDQAKGYYASTSVFYKEATNIAFSTTSPNKMHILTESALSNITSSLTTKFLFMNKTTESSSPTVRPSTFFGLPTQALSTSSDTLKDDSTPLLNETKSSSTTMIATQPFPSKIENVSEKEGVTTSTATLKDQTFILDDGPNLTTVHAANNENWNSLSTRLPKSTFPTRHLRVLDKSTDMTTFTANNNNSMEEFNSTFTSASAITKFDVNTRKNERSTSGMKFLAGTDSSTNEVMMTSTHTSTSTTSASKTFADDNASVTSLTAVPSNQLNVLISGSQTSTTIATSTLIKPLSNPSAVQQSDMETTPESFTFRSMAIYKTTIFESSFENNNLLEILLLIELHINFTSSKFIDQLERNLASAYVQILKVSKETMRSQRGKRSNRNLLQTNRKFKVKVFRAKRISPYSVEFIFALLENGHTLPKEKVEKDFRNLSPRLLSDTIYFPVLSSITAVSNVSSYKLERYKDVVIILGVFAAILFLVAACTIAYNRKSLSCAKGKIRGVEPDTGTASSSDSLQAFYGSEAQVNNTEKRHSSRLDSVAVQTEIDIRAEKSCKKLVTLQVSRRVQTDTATQLKILKKLSTTTTSTQTQPDIQKCNNAKKDADKEWNDLLQKLTAQQLQSRDLSEKKKTSHQDYAANEDVEKNPLFYLPSLPSQKLPLVMQPVLDQGLSTACLTPSTGWMYPALTENVVTEPKTTEVCENTQKVLHECSKEERRQNKKRMRKMMKNNLKLNQKKLSTSKDTHLTSKAEDITQPLTVGSLVSISKKQEDKSSSSLDVVLVESKNDTRKEKRKRKRKPTATLKSKLENKDKLRQSVQCAQQKLDLLMNIKHNEILSPAYIKYQAGNRLRWKPKTFPAAKETNHKIYNAQVKRDNWVCEGDGFASISDTPLAHSPPRLFSRKIAFKNAAETTEGMYETVRLVGVRPATTEEKKSRLMQEILEAPNTVSS
ncbi:uncharacterized protein LOC143458974 [Clavelina lepadiformis]|uniref:uncharacterized protein LOC143458974 n=1 Tax=Clavelina lepadiformis TaxID=159417 RepID=UPI0040419AF7